MTRRNKDYGIVDLESDALFKRLPKIVQSTDPGGIRAYAESMAENHNFLADLLRELPRLQDPTQAAKFTPEQFGEDPELFNEYIRLRRRWHRLSSSERQYMNQELAPRIPKSVRALELEAQILSLLSATVGEKSYTRFIPASIRRIIATAVQRHHVKGSHLSYYLLGRITGYIGLKVTELWSRFAIKDPANPGSVVNNGDFAVLPDRRPYWPLGPEYDGVRTTTVERVDGYGAARTAKEVYSVPEGSLLYDPFNLSDGGETFSAIFENLKPQLNHPDHYNRAINGHNPFGNFLRDVDAYLLPGTYTLANGRTTRRAYVDVPSLGKKLNEYCQIVDVPGATTFRFEAIAFGEWANGVTVAVGLLSDGTQQITITGPQSTIKFKTSYFDLTIGADLIVFADIYPPHPVVTISDTTYLDASLNRVVPDYPVTGSLPGTYIISDPTREFQMDMVAHQELMQSILGLTESLRPITRETRRVLDGFLVSDTILYAPVNTLAAVTLQAPNGQLYALTIDAVGNISWVATEEGEHISVVQRDAITGNLMRWTISNAGIFAAISNFRALGEQLVYFRSSNYTGYVFVQDSLLVASKSAPEVSIEAIHTDGTVDESVISKDYALVVENPPDSIIPYMSADATSTDTPPANFSFQPAPEDDLDALLEALDESGFYLEPSWDINQYRQYGWDGFIGEDVRFRHAGIEATVVEPVPTGDATRQDGLRYDHPVQFMDYHGEWVWRDRVSNIAYRSWYTYDSPDADTGPVLHTEPLVDAATGAITDGPIEGTLLVAADGSAGAFDSVRGYGPTPNGQVFGPEKPEEWRRDLFRDYYFHGDITNVIDSDSGGEATIDVGGLPVNTFVRVTESQNLDGVHKVTVYGDAQTTLDATFTGNDSGKLAVRIMDIPIWGVEDIKVSLLPSSGVTQYVVYQWTASGGEVILASGSLEAGDDTDLTFLAVADGRVYIEIGSSSTGTLRIRRLGDEPSANSPGFNMWRSGRTAMEVTLTQQSQRFHDHDQDGIDPLTPLGVSSTRWHRGGTWRGLGQYHYTSRPSPLPSILVVENILVSSSSSSSLSSVNSSSSSSSSQSSLSSTSSSSLSSHSSSSLSTLTTVSTSSSSSSLSSLSSSSLSSLSSASTSSASSLSSNSSSSHSSSSSVP